MPAFLFSAVSLLTHLQCDQTIPYNRCHLPQRWHATPLQLRLSLHGEAISVQRGNYHEFHLLCRPHTRFPSPPPRIRKPHRSHLHGNAHLARAGLNHARVQRVQGRAGCLHPVYQGAAAQHQSRSCSHFATACADRTT